MLVLLGSGLSRYIDTWGASFDTGCRKGGAVRFGFGLRCWDPSVVAAMAGADSMSSVRSRAARLPGGGGSGMVNGFQVGWEGRFQKRKSRQIIPAAEV